MASNDLGDWYRSIPQISRYWFTGAVALPLAGKLGLFNPMTMILHYEMVVHHFQVRVIVETYDNKLPVCRWPSQKASNIDQN